MVSVFYFLLELNQQGNKICSQILKGGVLRTAKKNRVLSTTILTSDSILPVQWNKVPVPKP